MVNAAKLCLPRSNVRAAHQLRCNQNSRGLCEAQLPIEMGPAVWRVFNTVCARRFWDQHEMSLQTATGRSLP